MRLIDKLTTAIDDYGVSGFTVWILPDGRIQANVCRPDKVSWICHTGDDVQGTISDCLDEFLDGPKAKRDARKRVVKISSKRKRDIDDLA